MKHFYSALLMAVGSLSLMNSALRAQVVTPVIPQQTSPVIVEGMTHKIHAATGGGCAQSCKVCVSEPKPHTKTVYSCKCEEYCQPRCSLCAILRGKCGGNCENGECGQVRVRHRLIVKRVPDCDGKQCVVKEAPVVPCGGGEVIGAPKAK